MQQEDDQISMRSRRLRMLIWSCVGVCTTAISLAAIVATDGWTIAVVSLGVVLGSIPARRHLRVRLRRRSAFSEFLVMALLVIAFLLYGKVFFLIVAGGGFGVYILLFLSDEAP
jgi:hypothetical protein